MRLLLEGDHLRRQFCGRSVLREIDELPAFDLATIAQVKIFGERVMLPSAAVVDGGAAPDAGGAVEMHEAPTAVSRGVLDDEMAVEEDRLRFGEQRRVAIEVIPSHLHHADLVIREV